MDAILNRRSVRKFDMTKKVSYDTLVDLCRYGEAAPSAKNQKGRAYVIVDDEDLIQKLSGVSPNAAFLMSCPAVIAVIGLDSSTLRSARLHHQDLAAATENILVAAASKGIGSCWIGITPIEERVTLCDALLKVTDGAHTFSLIALGYPQDENAFYDANKLTETMLFHNEFHHA